MALSSAERGRRYRQNSREKAKAAKRRHWAKFKDRINAKRRRKAKAERDKQPPRIKLGTTELRKRGVAYSRSYRRSPKMHPPDVDVLTSLMRTGGGDRVAIWAGIKREISMNTVDNALTRCRRFGLVRQPHQRWYEITERGRIAWALWQTKKRLAIRVDAGR